MRSVKVLVTFALALTLTLALAQDQEEVISWSGAEKDLDLFSSVSELQKLYKKELEIKAKLQDFMQDMQDKIKKIEFFLNNSYVDENVSGDDNHIDSFIANPINTFTILKRTGLQLPSIKDLISVRNGTDQGISELLTDLPDPAQVEGAANGIFLLHETYNLNLTKFAEGELEVPGSTAGEVVSGVHKLTLHDLEQLGKLAFNRGFYDRATEWLEAAVVQAKANELDQATISKLQSILTTMQKHHDQVLEKRGPFGDDWRTFAIPFDSKLRKKKKYKKVKSKRFRTFPKLFKSVRLTDAELWENFNALCRGEQLRSPEIDKDLSCYYLHHNDPYIKLGPFKMEQKNLQPFISVIHDFIYDNEAESMKDFARDKLRRSMHLSRKGEPHSTSVKRTSSQTWINESDDEGKPLHQAAFKVSTRIERATQLQALWHHGSESFQVANYGIGGVYNHHTDSMGEAALFTPSSDDLLDLRGDRLSTTMGYLSEVRAGGATVFPAVGVTIWPKKGSLAFWFNNDHNGQIDIHTFHGGCPVLAGSKWITNKWIRSFAQWKRYPCLDPRHVKSTKVKPVTNSLLQL